MIDKDLQNKMLKMSQDAVILAAKMNYQLDYSNESIVSAEKFFDFLYQDAQKREVSEEQFQMMANLFGAYAGTCLIRNLRQGEWKLEPTNNAYGVMIDQNYTFFPAKVYKRLKNGPEENVVYLYQSVYNRSCKNQISLKIF